MYSYKTTKIGMKTSKYISKSQNIHTWLLIKGHFENAIVPIFMT